MSCHLRYSFYVITERATGQKRWLYGFTAEGESLWSRNKDRVRTYYTPEQAEMDRAKAGEGKIETHKLRTP